MEAEYEPRRITRGPQRSSVLTVDGLSLRLLSLTKHAGYSSGAKGPFHEISQNTTFLVSPYARFSSGHL